MSGHLDLLQRLLPPFSLDPNGIRLLVELRAEAAVLDAAMSNIESLLLEMLPSSATALFPEYETYYGLPDDCSGGLAQSSAERRAALIALDQMQGEMTVDWYVRFAALLGYTITITELRPHITEDDTEFPTYDEQYNHVWQVNAPLTSIIESTTEDNTEMATAVWGNQRLECSIRRWKPAHHHVLFAYH